jgi:serine/threonine protein kinase
MSLDQKTNKFAMVSEWMIHGDINEFVEKSEGVNRVQLVSEDAISQGSHCNLLVQLVEATNGLEYMHSLNMVHGDLKGVWFH